MATKHEQVSAAAGGAEVRADIIGMCLRSIKGDKVDMDVDLEVDNPNSLPLQLVDIEFVVEDVTKDDSGEAEERRVVHVFQHACSIQPRTSEVIKVPLRFACMKPPATSSSTGGSAGRIIPFTIRARLNFCETLRGVFQITIGRFKQFLTIVDRKLGIGRLRSFVPPTGFVNGAHLLGVTSTEVQLNFEARVRNGNPLPIQFLYTDISIESNGEQLTDSPIRIQHNITLGARTSRKVSIPVILPLQQLMDKVESIKHGTVVPYTAKIDYWFKENFYGMYKVPAEKEGEFPIPLEPVVKIQAASFHRNEEQQPAAKVCLKLQNRNEFGMQVKKFQCEIESVEGGETVCVVSSDGEFVLEVDAGGESSIWMVASPSEGNEDSFGSALWDVFTENFRRYRIATSIKATTKFGSLKFVSNAAQLDDV